MEIQVPDPTPDCSRVLYPTVSQNGDFVPDVYFNQGKKPTNVIELDAAVIAL